MSKLAEFVRPTTIVRQVMYKHGRRKQWGVFTNLYAKCHTVKCYAAGSATDSAMIEEIKAVLTELGVEHTIRHTAAPSMFRHGAVIVRIPRGE